MACFQLAFPKRKKEKKKRKQKRKKESHGGGELFRSKSVLYMSKKCVLVAHGITLSDQSLSTKFLRIGKKILLQFIFTSIAEYNISLETQYKEYIEG